METDQRWEFNWSGKGRPLWRYSFWINTQNIRQPCDNCGVRVFHIQEQVRGLWDENKCGMCNRQLTIRQVWLRNKKKKEVENQSGGGLEGVLIHSKDLKLSLWGRLKAKRPQFFNFSVLAPFAMWICTFSHQEAESVLSCFDSSLTSWLAWPIAWGGNDGMLVPN